MTESCKPIKVLVTPDCTQCYKTTLETIPYNFNSGTPLNYVTFPTDPNADDLHFGWFNDYIVAYRYTGTVWQVEGYRLSIAEQQTLDWVNILNKPTTFPPTNHTHSTYESQILALQNDVDTAELDIDNLQTAIVLVQTDVSTLQTDITTLEISDIALLQTTLDGLQDDIDLFAGDDWGTQVVEKTSAFTGNGTLATPLGLADNAVTNTKIADGSISTTKIMDGQITNLKLGNNSVIESKITDLAVTTNKIADGSITSAKLATDSVVEANILNSAVTVNKIANNSVITAKILDNNVTTAKIADNAVTTSKITDNNVTSAKIADLNVTSAKLATSGVTAGTYTIPSITVNNKGIITSASNGVGTGITMQTAEGSIMVNASDTYFTVCDLVLSAGQWKIDTVLNSEGSTSFVTQSQLFNVTENFILAISKANSTSSSSPDSTGYNSISTTTVITLTYTNTIRLRCSYQRSPLFNITVEGVITAIK